MTVTPYVVAQWVRGDKFYGRTELIQEVLQGNRDAIWLLGTRRIGKTSLLRQLELIAAQDSSAGYFPLFWNLEGASDPDSLSRSFIEAVLDAEERLEDLGIPHLEIEDQDLARSVAQLRRALNGRQQRLLLLCDEVDELIALNDKEPIVLRKLRAAIDAEGIRTVLASTIQLWDLNKGQNLHFLDPFIPPLYIRNLLDDEAQSLILQNKLPLDSRPGHDNKTVELVREHCDCHPYLIQLLCTTLSETKSLDRAIEHVATHPMVSFYFQADFDMLSDVERDILRIVGQHDSSTSNSIREVVSADSDVLGQGLHRLEYLGYVRRTAEDQFVLANHFFRRWFHKPETPVTVDPGSSRTTMLTMELQVGNVLDSRYDIVERLGKGATGIVYRAHDRQLSADVAVKVLNFQYTIHEEAVERLRREVVLARALAHPNIVQVYHLGEDPDGRKYVTMQWIDGLTLAQIVYREAPFSTTRALEVAISLANALEAAHTKGILHRDLKPTNVLMDKKGDPHISDFGLARLIGDRGLTQDGIFVGTPDYASPEQAERTTDLDERSDLYSLGVILFEMTTGRRPFKGRSTQEVLRMHLHEPPPSPRDLVPSVPRKLSKTILRCLEKERGDRYQMAADLRRALRKVKFQLRATCRLPSDRPARQAGGYSKSKTDSGRD